MRSKSLSQTVQSDKAIGLCGLEPVPETSSSEPEGAGAKVFAATPAPGRRPLPSRTQAGTWLLTGLVLVLFGITWFVYRSSVASLTTRTQPAGDRRESSGEPDDSAAAAGINREQMTFEDMFQEIAPQHGLDWELLAAQAYVESRLDPLAVGAKHELGLMQIKPSTWREWAPKVGVSNPFDPYSNILVGAAYLRFLRDYFEAKGYAGDYWMLVAYNWGPNNLRRLVETEGGSTRIPARQRQYALDIVRRGAE